MFLNGFFHLILSKETDSEHQIWVFLTTDHVEKTFRLTNNEASLCMSLALQ